MILVEEYNPAAWFWVVGGDTSRAWSSAASSYVTEWNSARCSRVPSESALDAEMRRCGLASPIITADDVRAECQRRIIALVGATDLLNCIIKQLNANMRANELNDKQINGTLTPDEQVEAEALRAMALKIKDLRAASNVLEASRPANYIDDQHWPA